jgi:hypothetical protein
MFYRRQENIKIYEHNSLLSGKKRLKAEAFFYLMGFIAPGLSRGLNLKKEKIGFSH